MRSFPHSVRDQFAAGLDRIVHGICAVRGVSAEAAYEKNYPPLVNGEEETAIAARAAARVVGAKNVDTGAARIMGSEDFAFMLLKRLGNYVMIGNGEGEHGGCMVHNPHYDFNDEILPIGASCRVEPAREPPPHRSLHCPGPSGDRGIDQGFFPPADSRPGIDAHRSSRERRVLHHPNSSSRHIRRARPDAE